MKEDDPGVELQENGQKPSDDCIQRSNGVESRTDGVFNQHTGEKRAKPVEHVDNPLNDDQTLSNDCTNGAICCKSMAYGVFEYHAS
jgi:hypothetical protein